MVADAVSGHQKAVTAPSPGAVREVAADVLLACCVRPVFVVGASRAGTTWLQSLLSLHPALFSPPETKLFQCVLDRHRLLTFRELYPQRRKPIPRLLRPTDLETAFRHLDEIGLIEVGADVRESLRRLAAGGFLDPCTLLNVIAYNNAHDRHDAVQKLWVEKTPRHIFFLEDIFRLFPAARVICIQRDVVDQAASAYRTFQFPVIHGLLDGMRSYRAIDDFVKRHPSSSGRIAIVTYEALRTDPQAVMDRLCAFLNLPALGSNENDLADLSKRAFAEIYGQTPMAAVQPQMSPRGAGRAREEPAFARRLFLLSRLVWGDAGRYVTPRRYAVSDYLAAGFVSFVLFHFAHAAAFAVRVILRDTVVRIRRVFPAAR